MQCLASRFGEEWAKREFGNAWRAATVRGSVAGILRGGSSYRVKYDGMQEVKTTRADYLEKLTQEELETSNRRMRKRSRNRISRAQSAAAEAAKEKSKRKKKRRKGVAECLIKSSMRASAPLRLPDFTRAMDVLTGASALSTRQKIVNQRWRKQAKTYEEELFPRLHKELLAGFSGLLCGVGSKMKILQSFTENFLCERSEIEDAAVVEVHGFRQEFHLATLVDAIAEDLLARAPSSSAVVGVSGSANFSTATTSSSKTATEQRLALSAAGRSQSGRTRPRLADDVLLRKCRSIASAFGPNRPDTSPASLYIVVHSIDGVALRSSLVQTGLSILAAASNIHLVASMDHINGPLIWSQKTKERFNWLWHDATTWHDFFHEAAFESETPDRRRSSIAGSRGASRGIAHVLESVTRNHRDVWKTLAQLQIDHEKDRSRKNSKTESSSSSGSSAFGITFHRFYELCVAQMYVRDDRMLTTLLREMIDHAIVATRSGPDGNTLYEIPHPKEVIEHHLRALKSATQKKAKDYSA